MGKEWHPNGYLYLVYALVDPRDSRIRYVGSTKDPEQRYSLHCGCKSGSSAVTAWVEELRAECLLPQMVEIDQVRAWNTPRQEVHWIRTLSEAGAPLLNYQYNRRRAAYFEYAKNSRRKHRVA